MTVFKIIRAGLLHRKVPDRGEQVSIVIQFSDFLATFNLNKNEKHKKLCDLPHETMAHLPMICAPNNQLYYIKSTRRVDKLMAIYQKGSEVYDQKVQEFPSKIL